MANVKVDIKALKELERELEQMTEVTLRRLGERAHQLLRDDIKKNFGQGNLWQGVAPPDYDFAKKTAVITVSARSARRGWRPAKLHTKSGETKDIRLRPIDPYNYAEVVALGNRYPRIYPREAKALIIPVDSAPSGESYVTEGSQIFIVRRSKAGRKGNPYHERAAKQLQEESVKIVMGVVEDFRDGR